MTSRAPRRLSRAAAALGSLGLVAALAACSTGSDAELGSAENPVQLGIVDAGEAYWAAFEEAASAEGIAVDLVGFGDYPSINPALSEGELHVNQFQHTQYLANYNVDAGDDLQPIGATAIYPLGLYSTQYDSVAAIPDGAEIAIPDDDVNGARALLVLQAQGLVALEDGGSPYSTTEDIIADESRVQIRQLDAALTATSLPDVAAAVINNNYISDAGLTADDAIAQDDPADPSAVPYINLFVTTADLVDNEVLARLVEIYQTDEAVQQGVLDASGGTAVLVTTPKAELQETLRFVESEKREQ